MNVLISQAADEIRRRVQVNDHRWFAANSHLFDALSHSIWTAPAVVRLIMAALQLVMATGRHSRGMSHSRRAAERAPGCSPQAHC
jgi:hypothetical protein